MIEGGIRLNRPFGPKSQTQAPTLRAPLLLDRRRCAATQQVFKKAGDALDAALGYLGDAIQHFFRHGFSRDLIHVVQVGASFSVERDRIDAARRVRRRSPLARAR